MTNSIPRRQALRRAVLILTFLLMPVVMNYFSPYLIIDGAFQGIVSGSFLVFGGLFIGSLFLGRLWCSWACPMAGVAEIGALVNNRTPDTRRMHILRWLIWGLWLAGIAAAAFTAGGLREVRFFYMSEGIISVDEPARYVIYYGVVGIFIAITFLAGKRAACHSICWMAPFMILGRNIRNLPAWPALRLKANPDACKDCMKCTRGCPMSLDVHAMVKANAMENSECILCGNCIDTCASQVIRYSFSQGKS